jgi:glycosyltransferase 2 family protein
MWNRSISEFKRYKKDIFWIFVFAVLFAFLLPDKQTIINTLNEIKGADLSWIIIGSIFYYLTIPIYTIQILVLSKKKLNSWITYKVQMSVLFINKFLPTAVCSFVMNSFYLERMGNKASQIASILSMQALTSAIPFTILFITAIVIGISRFNLNSDLNVDLSSINWLKLAILLLIVILTIIFILYSSEKIRKFIKNSIESFWDQFKDYKNRPKSIFWALMTGFVAPFFGVAVLYASGHSVGLDVTFIESFLIYALATTMANLIPVPGGIGAAEAGLYAGFIFFGYPPAESMAASLIYRIITFWIPIFPGFYFFVNLRKNVLKGFSIKRRSKKTVKA